MKVTISVLGRFHAFNLAQQVQKRNSLHRLISSYPTWEIAKYGIAESSIDSILHLEILARAWRKLPNCLKQQHNLQLWFAETFDRCVTKKLLSDLDVFVGWSGSSLCSLRQAKAMGAMTVVERGSSHIEYQTQILKEEYDRWGLKFNATHPGICDRELQEYQEADRIAIPSLFAKRTFIAQGLPESKLIHVPYGTSLTEFYPVPKEDNIFRVIHCGSINLRKGVLYLIQAFYELNLPDAELWLVGSIAPEIEPFLAKYQSDRIIFKGTYPQNQLRWFYAQCSVFCLASIEEGLAMVQSQAMACALPVIHTTNTGGEDIVRDGIDGFCIPIRNVETLKEKIMFFYEHPDRRNEMGNNALEQVKTSYSWDQYGEEIIQTYAQISSSQ